MAWRLALRSVLQSSMRTGPDLPPLPLVHGHGFPGWIWRVGKRELRPVESFHHAQLRSWRKTRQRQEALVSEEVLRWFTRSPTCQLPQDRIIKESARPYLRLSPSPISSSKPPSVCVDDTWAGHTVPPNCEINPEQYIAAGASSPNCYQYFCGWDIMASHLLMSFTTWCEWKSPTVNVPPLITVFLAFGNMMATTRSSNCRCDQSDRIIRSERASEQEQESWQVHGCAFLEHSHNSVAQNRPVKFAPAN